MIAGVFDDFSEEIQRDVEGLVWLGHLESEINWCGHTFVIRTLKAEEDLVAGLLAKEYIDSVAASKAWAWANIALALVAVDGDTNFCPAIGPDKVANARARFRWVTENWYWPVAEYLFACYLELVDRQKNAIREVEDLSSRSLNPSMPFADSLTEEGDSTEMTSIPSNSDS